MPRGTRGFATPTANTPGGQGPSALSDALDGHPPPQEGGAAGALHGLDLETDLNLAVLRGAVVEGQLDPEGGSGELAVLTISFPAGEAYWTNKRLPPALCEIVVPAPIARRFGKRLRVDDEIHVVGTFGTNGRIVAWFIGTEPPFERAHR